MNKSIRIRARGIAYCIALNCPNPIPVAVVHMATPPSPGLFWADEIHFLLGGFAQSNVFWGVERRKACTGHEPDLRELRRGRIGGEEKEGAIGHVEIAKESPAWCMGYDRCFRKVVGQSQVEIDGCGDTGRFVNVGYSGRSRCLG